MGKFNDLLTKWDRRNQAAFEQDVEDGWDAGGQPALRRYIDRHPLRYAVMTGFLLGACTWAKLDLPIWVGLIVGLAMTLAFWTGLRADGWLRRLRDTGTTKRPPRDQLPPDPPRDA